LLRKPFETYKAEFQYVEEGSAYSRRLKQTLQFENIIYATEKVALNKPQINQ
jgi:hypothetical protein